MARAKAIKTRRAIKATSRTAEPIHADPAAHTGLVERFREWNRQCEIWAWAERGDPAGEVAYEAMGRLSRECRERLVAEVPIGVRLLIDSETDYVVWHNGTAGTYNFDIDRQKLAGTSSKPRKA